MRRIYFSCDNGCCEGGNDTRNEFIEKIKSTTPGPQGKSIQGPPGKDNIVKGSQIGNAGQDVDGSDATLGVSTVSDLQSLGLDMTTLETIRTTLDTSDPVNTKWFVRISNALANLLASFRPKFVKAGGTIGQIPVKNSGTDYDWSWTSPSGVISLPYKTTSTTSSTSIGVGSKTLTVDLNMQFEANVIVCARDSSDSANYVLGPVTSYNPSNGQLIINSLAFGGSGSPSGWNVNIGYTPFIPPVSGEAGKVLSNDGVDFFWSQTATIPTGITTDYYGTTAPDDWAFADGSTVPYIPSSPKGPSNPYRDLAFTMGANSIGSEFYVSPTSFRLPDRRRRVGVGFDSSGTGVYDKLGLQGGEETHLLTAAESGVPAHSHNFPTSAQLAVGFNGSSGDIGQIQNVSGTIINTENNTASPASTAHNNMQPYEVCNVIVKL